MAGAKGTLGRCDLRSASRVMRAEGGGHSPHSTPTSRNLSSQYLQYTVHPKEAGVGSRGVRPLGWGEMQVGKVLGMLHGSEVEDGDLAAGVTRAGGHGSPML